MDKILDKIIRQVIVEATTRKRLTKQIDSDTILTKLIKQVITEAAQKVVLSKLDNKVAAIVSNYGFGFKISANYPNYC
jgi:predicted YcjX-like family ATPase